MWKKPCFHQRFWICKIWAWVGLGVDFFYMLVGGWFFFICMGGAVIFFKSPTEFSLFPLPILNNHSLIASVQMHIIHYEHLCLLWWIQSDLLQQVILLAQSPLMLATEYMYLHRNRSHSKSVHVSATCVSDNLFGHLDSISRLIEKYQALCASFNVENGQ